MRILLIEDEHKLSSFKQRELVAEGYESEIASDGPSGLEMATTAKFDVIVLDLHQMSQTPTIQQSRPQAFSCVVSFSVGTSFALQCPS